MHNRARRSWQAVVMVAVAALVASIVVAAVQATGPSDVRASSNDGGAWLIRRDKGLAGHMNRSVGEVSGTVKVAKPAAVFDVEESANVLAALDSSSNTVSVIDPRTFQVANTLTVPNDVRMIAADDDVILWTPTPLVVWRLDRRQALRPDLARRGHPAGHGQDRRAGDGQRRRHHLGARRRGQDRQPVPPQRRDAAGGAGR